MTRNRLAKLSLSVLAAAAILASALPAQAHTYRRNSSADENPVRFVAYFVHPIGIALEYLITRPVHYIVSQPHLDILCGHKAHPDDVYFEWTHADRSPGIAEYYEKHAPAPAPEAAPAPAEAAPAEAAPAEAAPAAPAEQPAITPTQ